MKKFIWFVLILGLGCQLMYARKHAGTPDTDPTKKMYLELNKQCVNWALVRKYVDSGAQYWERDYYGLTGLTAMEFAARAGKTSMVLFLEKKWKHREGSRYPAYSALQEAVKAGHLKTARIMLAGCDACDRFGDWNGNGLLFDAKTKAMVNLLLYYGADIHIKDYYGRTILFNAIPSGNKGWIRFLIKKGVEINARDNSGKTPLDYANNEGMKKMLRAHGAKMGGEL